MPSRHSSFLPYAAVLAVLTCLLGTRPVVAQQVERFAISGTVVDADTREPLPFVNVFLASTALGAVTDTVGNFEIRNVPTGAYDLIFSNPGYDREVRRVEVQRRDSKSIQVRLREKVIETKPIEIVGEQPSEWKDQLALFTQKFFGTTRNGASCTILNPEVLEFSETEFGRFEASASAPIQIENRATGYRLELILRYFVSDGKVLKISGWPRFEEMTPSGDEEKERWRAARVRTYNGSLRHFLAALVKGTVKEEGFQMSLVREIASSPRMSLIPESELREQIVHLGPLSFERELSFGDYLKVSYLHEFQESGFEKYWEEILGWGRTYSERHQFSWLRLAVRPVMLSAEGLPYDSSQMETFGYWAYERIGEWLPLEYQP